jgi:hypothetical protein
VIRHHSASRYDYPLIPKPTSSVIAVPFLDSCGKQGEPLELNGVATITSITNGFTGSSPTFSLVMSSTTIGVTHLRLSCHNTNGQSTYKDVTYTSYPPVLMAAVTNVYGVNSSTPTSFQITCQGMCLLLVSLYCYVQL